MYCIELRKTLIDLFRKYEGNFYTAIVYSVKQLFSKEDNSLRENNAYVVQSDSINIDLEDTAELFQIFEKL